MLEEDGVCQARGQLPLLLLLLFQKKLLVCVQPQDPHNASLQGIPPSCCMVHSANIAQQQQQTVAITRELVEACPRLPQPG